MYCNGENILIEKSFIVDYLGNVAGINDVIRTINHNGRNMFYTAVDRDGYGMYNYQRSIYRGEFIWEYHHGDIREMYEPFRKRGVIFEDDIYAKIDQSDREFMQKVRELHLFNH